MRIAFDHSIFTIQSFGGVSRYFARLAENLNSPDDDVRVFAPLHLNQYLDELPREKRFGFGVTGYPKPLKELARKANFSMAKQMINAWKPDILHETYYGIEPISPTSAALVVTMHDMITEIFPEKFPKAALVTKRKRQAVERADHVICISENTRKDLHQYFDVPTQKVSVVYHGVDVLPRSSNTENPTERPYFLYVGSRLEYKNFRLLIEAFASSEKLKRDFQIVAFGGGSFSSDEKKTMANLGLSTEHVTFASGSDQLLEQYYRFARAFVYPTQYEGFGFPPLEAMAAGCPVVCSNSSCIPEVVGDAALMFDPNSKEELQDALHKVAFDESTCDLLKARGIIHHKKFSWQKCAAETRLIYAKLSRA